MTRVCIGVDEAGRGPLAGPVAVGAVASLFTNEKIVHLHFKDIAGRDSKKLSERKREEVFARIKNLERDGKLTFAVAFVGAQSIDRFGIVSAIRRGVARVLNKLSDSSADSVLLDGGLSAPDRYVNQKTIIKGDETELLISLASICAKVLRDSKMTRLHTKYPEYGFAQHKGYGTVAHREVIRSHGICQEHRKSFLTHIWSSQ